MRNPDPPTFRILRKACKEYQRTENPTYRVATAFIDKSWGRPKDVGDGICVLLLIWNKAFYSRFGAPNFRMLTRVLKSNISLLNELRSRSILSYRSETDAKHISRLFHSFLRPLSAKERNTPVGVAKALHLVAPDFLPLWDVRIAKTYGCAWSATNPAAVRYLQFVQIIQRVCKHVVEDYVRVNHVSTRSAVKMVEDECSSPDFRHSLVKLVDEYNFVKFVKPWLG